jgi:hypothetical protein
MAKPVVQVDDTLKMIGRDRRYAQGVADAMNALGDDDSEYGTRGMNGERVTNKEVRRRWVDYVNKDGVRILKVVYDEVK